MRRLLAVAAVVLSLAGCSSGEVESGDLDGRTFTSTEVTGHDLVEGTSVALAFADGQLSVSAGCNNQAAAYEVDGDLLQWTGQAASTMMACADDLTAQDAWLAGLLTDGVTVALDGSTLTLTSGEVEMVLEAD